MEFWYIMKYYLYRMFRAVSNIFESLNVLKGLLCIDGVCLYYNLLIWMRCIIVSGSGCPEYWIPIYLFCYPINRGAFSNKSQKILGLANYSNTACTAVRFTRGVTRQGFKCRSMAPSTHSQQQPRHSPRHTDRVTWLTWSTCVSWFWPTDQWPRDSRRARRECNTN